MSFFTRRRFQQKNGFALVISLSLMVLLTVLAVGLLSLSTVSLRASTHADAQQTARSNARLALMLAIGQLQKTAGPDQRISAPADLVNPALPQGVAGVWKSWKTPTDGSADYELEKKNRFAGYIMSAPEFPATVDATKLPGGGLPTQIMVGEGSLGKGSTAREVSAPVVSVGTQGSPGAGSLAWVALDEGVKGRIDLLPEEDTSTGTLGKNITRMGSSARNKAGDFAGLETLDADVETLTATLPKLVSTDEVNLMSADKDTFGRYFHDFSVTNSTLQTDVANGGMKTDLSVAFDRATLPTSLQNTRVYSGTTSPFLGNRYAADPTLNLFHHFYRLYQRTTTNDNPLDGMKTYVPSRYLLQPVADRTLRTNRYEPDMSRLTESVIMPTVVKIDMVFSLVARDAHGVWKAGGESKGFPRMLHMMYMPVFTLHNPYNTPIRFTQFEVEFEHIPLGFQFLVNNQPANDKLYAFNQLFSGNEGGVAKKFKFVLTGDINALREVVIGPGETRIFGKPFPDTLTWGQDVAVNGGWSFDHANNKTQQGSKIAPGMITDETSSIGYDIDWLAPGTKPTWMTTRENAGIIRIKDTETVGVRFGPAIPAGVTSNNMFQVHTRLVANSTTNYSTTQVFYKDEARLRQILEEGTSPRFENARSFPENFPKTPIDRVFTVRDIYEADGTPVRDYEKPKPFAIFSLSAKTTMDSFTRSRPVADTGLTNQMATCDFTTTASQGASPLEFALVPVQGGKAAIQSDGLKGFFFGGHGDSRGTTGATLYELPLAPMQSIAQLRNANTGGLGSPPHFTYTVGESRAHPALPPASAYLVDSGRILLDHSWLANDQLWDKFWFSSLASLQGKAYTGSEAISQEALAQAFFNGERQLPNPRNIPYLKPGSPAGETASSVVADTTGAKSSAQMLTKGGFNVNSTSRNAWISVLSAMANSSVPLVNNSLEQTGSDIPFLRVRRPVAGAKNPALDVKNRLWNSYRVLEETEIERLADEIVKEIRKRGPFLSMSEFVNRRLTGDDLGKTGAIQAAIDSAAINGAMLANSVAIDNAQAGNYGWKNPGAITNSTTGAGAPGEISQGDLLSAIGSFVTVRSDTFRIRAFGDSRDSTGKVLARAWCEATVQRFPDYVDPTDSPEIAATTEANKTFGRRFSVIAFRWLHPNEV